MLKVKETKFESSEDVSSIEFPLHLHTDTPLHQRVTTLDESYDNER